MDDHRLRDGARGLLNGPPSAAFSEITRRLLEANRRHDQNEVQVCKRLLELMHEITGSGSRFERF